MSSFLCWQLIRRADNCFQRIAARTMTHVEALDLEPSPVQVIVLAGRLWTLLALEVPCGDGARRRHFIVLYRDRVARLFARAW